MRDYAIVREEFWSLRRLNNTIVMGVIAAVAVGIPALASLSSQQDAGVLPLALLDSALTLDWPKEQAAIGDDELAADLSSAAVEESEDILCFLKF